MYRLQLDSETSLSDLNCLSDVNVCVIKLDNDNLYTPAINYLGQYICLDIADDLLFAKENIMNTYMRDQVAATMYVNNDQYYLIKDFQDFLFNNGIRSSLIRVDI